jgi:hypothetical protein
MNRASPTPRRSAHSNPLRRLVATALLASSVTTLCAFAAPAPSTSTAARTPHELIDALGIDVRQLLATPRPDRTPADAERDAAAQISALIASAPGHPQLTQADARGRSPLIAAVGDGYLPVVQALLTDPGVRLQINEPDKRGVSSWMLANFAPGATLVACQPGTLTLERAPLLEPYLRRMVGLLRDNAAPLVGIIQALEAAGADPQPEAAKRAWLARCPNAEPELRDALAEGPLVKTLVTHAIERQAAFNALGAKDVAKLPLRPPEGMVFLPHAIGEEAGRPELLKIEHLTCPVTDKPNLGGLTFKESGVALLKAIASTRAGIVEAVDVESIRKTRMSKPMLDYFRALIIRTLASYQCAGEHVFEQEFEFSIR